MGVICSPTTALSSAEGSCSVTLCDTSLTPSRRPLHRIPDSLPNIGNTFPSGISLPLSGGGSVTTCILCSNAAVYPDPSRSAVEGSARRSLATGGGGKSSRTAEYTLRGESATMWSMTKDKMIARSLGPTPAIVFVAGRRPYSRFVL